MNKEIFDNKSNPFTVPQGYFDTLQERVMNRIRTEENQMKANSRIIRMTPLRTLLAAAACIALIFMSASMYVLLSDKQSFVSQTVIDDDFYRWLYASDDATWLAEALEMETPDDLEFEYNEEDEAIIQFLERNNISVAAILYSFNFP